MESIALIGGSGFVGKNLCKGLRGKFQISVIDQKLDAPFFSQMSDVRAYEVDIAESDGLGNILQDIAPTIVVNLASLVTAERDLMLFDRMVSINLKIMLKMYDALRSRKDLRLFVQFGSAEEYGAIVPPYRESTREEPNSPYSLVKQLTTNTVLMLHKNYGFPACVVRPGNLFGKYQPDSKLMPYLIDKLRKNMALDLTGGEQKRDFIWVDDLARLLSELFARPERLVGKIVNVAYGKGIRIRDVAEFLKKALSSTSELHFGALPYRENEMMDFECDVQRLEEALEHGIGRTFFDALEIFLSVDYGVKS